MRLKKWGIVSIIALTILSLSFTNDSPKDKCASYYDAQLDRLLRALNDFKTVVQNNSNKDILLNKFFDCRNAYKNVEFLVDVFTPFKARLLNGADLLKIEEENPGDSLKPHGLQVIEGLLYANKINRKVLSTEISLFLNNVGQLRNDPDRIYYFRDEKIWEAMRLGTFRIISLGITGFDVPLSYHALPETRHVLSSIHTVVSFYKKGLVDTVYQKGNTLFKNADEYLRLHNDFNTFDRIIFIRDHINPISRWITRCSKQLGYINYNQRNPLNPDAPTLFATDIVDLAFFSPNEKYRLTKDRIELGKRLFYDSRISGTGDRSCASCHDPGKAFTDGLPRPSNLAGNKMLLRNTPTLWNAAIQTRQFYDSRTETLENQLSAVVHNADEMNGSLHNSIKNLIDDTSYYSLFRRAYPDDKECVTEYNIANAFSSYVRSLISLNSRFDRYMRGETDSFTKSEKNGLNLFMGKAKCGTCHYAPVFNGLTPPLYQETESEILAVPATDAPTSVLDTDPGKFSFTKVTLHKYAFKTSTVRNVALTAPYMHNGVFKTLEAVLEFYNDGGGAGRGISLKTQTLPTEKLHLSKAEMKDIISFLYTLTDTSGLAFTYPISKSNATY